MHNVVDTQSNSLIMVPSIRVLMCGLRRFCICTAFSLFQLTHLNDVSSRFLVVEVDKDENIDKDVIEAAGLYVRLKLF